VSWFLIIAMVTGSYGFKALGVFGLAGNNNSAVSRRLAPFSALIPASLFAALIAVQTVGADRSLSIDARLAGVAAAAVVAQRHAPFVVTVGVAMVVTAAVRAFAG